MLNDNKIEYVGLGEMRKLVTPLICDPKKTAKQLRDAVDPLIRIEDCDTLLLSDENISGGTGELFRVGKLYVTLAKRVEKISKAFKDYNIKYVFTTREYSRFYASAYCEFLRHNKRFITFKEYLNKFDYLGFSWNDVLNDVNESIMDDSIKIITFEDFIESEASFFKELVGEYQGSMSPYEDTNTRSAFKARTIKAANILAMSMDRKLVNKLLAPIDNKISKLEGSSKFNPWTPHEQKYLEEKYKNDLKSIYK